MRLWTRRRSRTSSAPIAFTTGMVNQMMMPFALTLTYVLTASLVVALTLVPALSRFVFRRYRPRRDGIFEKVKGAYGRSLQFALRHKVLPLAVAVGLLVAAVVGVVNMGISMIPSMSSMMGSGLSLTITGEDPEKLIELSEDVMAVVGEVEGYTEIENGMEDADRELNLVIDEDALTREGWTVAQLYEYLAGALSHETDSTKLEMGSSKAQVTIVDETHVLTRENILDEKVAIEGRDGESKEVAIGKFATLEESEAPAAIAHENSQKTITVTAEVADGYNNALLSRELQQKLDGLELPDGFSMSFGGELENIDTMLEQMMLLLIVGFVLIYLVMVAQFQSLLSPFIVMVTVPLAFTGGFAALWADGEQLTMMSLVFSQEIGASMDLGMALVVVGGLAYATLMTLYIVPVLYDLLYRKVPTGVDLGDESVDDDPGDAQAYLEALRGKHAAGRGDGALPA